MSNTRRGLRVWWACLLLFIQDSFVYRANAFIWMLTDVVTAVTMPLIWLSSYNGRHDIHGFSPSQMVVYYLVVLLVGSIVEAHVMWDMSYDIKQGKFNVHLIRPYSLMSYMFAANLGWRLVRTFVGLPAMALVAFAFRGYLPSTMSVNAGWQFWLAVVLGHVVSFSITYAIGLLSLWLYETKSLHHFYYLMSLIFSGQIAPIALFPAGLQTVARLLPFPYVIGFPASIFLRRISDHAIYEGYAIQVGWIITAMLLSTVLWRGGIKRYTAFGI